MCRSSAVLGEAVVLLRRSWTMEGLLLRCFSALCRWEPTSARRRTHWPKTGLTGRGRAAQCSLGSAGRELLVVVRPRADVSGEKPELRAIGS